jgi:hypothetical protein
MTPAVATVGPPDGSTEMPLTRASLLGGVTALSRSTSPAGTFVLVGVFAVGTASSVPGVLLGGGVEPVGAGDGGSLVGELGTEVGGASVVGVVIVGLVGSGTVTGPSQSSLVPGVDTPVCGLTK